MASRGVNKAIIVGNLGQDPEMRSTASGLAIATISVATSEVWKDKNSGEQQERTEWHRIVFFDKLAEIVGQYLVKGSKVYVEGQIRTQKWQDKDGNDRYTTEILGKEMQMLDSRGNQQDNQNHGAAPGQAPRNAAPNQSAPAVDPQYANFDDDIPF